MTAGIAPVSGSTARTWIIDGAIAVGFALVGLLELLARFDSAYVGSAAVWVSILFVTAVPAPLAFRRRAPLASLIAVSALLVLPRVFFSTTILFLNGLGALAFAVYSAARHGRHPRDLWAIVVPFAVFAVLSFVIPGFFSVDELGQSVPIVVAAWGLGLVLKSWARTRESLRQALADVTASQAQRQVEAIQAERARIARELHDVVAHCVTVMVVQSGSARLQLATNPAASDAALLAVERTGRQALVEMRRMLGVLTDDGIRDLDPQPSLAELDSLAASFASAGMRVDVTTEGEPVDLPPGIGLSAYRIVQESLTNALAHGSPERSRVTISYGADGLDIEVVNAKGHGPLQRSSGGHGIAGMRERASLFGGTFESGPVDDGGFRVHTSFPISEPA